MLSLSPASKPIAMSERATPIVFAQYSDQVSVTHCPSSFHDTAGSFGYFSAFEIRYWHVRIADMADHRTSAGLTFY